MVKPPPLQQESVYVPAVSAEGSEQNVALIPITLAGAIGITIGAILIAVVVALVPPSREAASNGSAEQPTASPVVLPSAEPTPEVVNTTAVPVSNSVPNPPGAAGAPTEIVDPSVVTIEANGTLGSGFVIDNLGTIVTNFHVIDKAQSGANVVFANGERRPVSGFLHAAPGIDLALLRVSLTGLNVPPLQLADTPPLRGERVWAFGSPGGLTGTVTDGIVSGVRTTQDLDHVLPVKLSELFGYELGTSWIQITAPINGGNSGGPLVSTDGKVVGVNTLSLTGAQGLNFAVSVEHLHNLARHKDGILRPMREIPKPPLRRRATPQPTSPRIPNPKPVPPERTRELTAIQSPPHAQATTYFSDYRGVVPLVITTQRGQNYFVKIVDASTGSTTISIFLVGGRSSAFTVPPGSYQLRYATGRVWYGYRDIFGESGRYYSYGEEIRGYRSNEIRLRLPLDDDSALIDAADF